MPSRCNNPKSVILHPTGSVVRQQPVRCALPKGRYLEYSTRILHSVGISVKPLRYHYYCPLADTLFYLLKPRDTARLFGEGLFDVALCPDEWIIEDQLGPRSGASSLVEIKPIRYCAGNARVSLLVPRNSCTASGVTRVATEYAFIAADYMSRRGIRADIIQVCGSTEALVGTVVQCGIDCVESGRTAAAHGLMEKEIIYRNLGLSLLAAPQTKNTRRLINRIAEMCGV